MPIVLVFALFLISAPSVASTTGPQSFSAAKRMLVNIYQELDKSTSGELSTIYCGCNFHFEGKKIVPDLAGCGYEVRREGQRNRAERIEWEHVMPAYDFGRQMTCWQEGGRKNCGKDTTFKRMEADLHNLYPAIGEVNGDRSNFGFSDWNGPSTDYGRCEMVIDFKGKKAQPPQRSRGQIARSYLYMEQQHNIRLSSADKRLYEAWNRMYPADQQECKRHAHVAKAQGWPNPFIAAQCAAFKG
ncbi:MAG: endonuclease [Ferrimonas sp.]